MPMSQQGRITEDLDWGEGRAAGSYTPVSLVSVARIHSNFPSNFPSRQDIGLVPGQLGFDRMLFEESSRGGTTKNLIATLRFFASLRMTIRRFKLTRV